MLSTMPPYIHIHTPIHIYIHNYTHIQTHTYIHTHHTYTYIYLYTGTPTCARAKCNTLLGWLGSITVTTGTHMAMASLDVIPAPNGYGFMNTWLYICVYMCVHMWWGYIIHPIYAHTSTSTHTYVHIHNLYSYIHTHKSIHIPHGQQNQVV